MKAAVLAEGGRFMVRDVPRPEPSGHQVLIRVTYCGVCGSDLHALRAGALSAGAILGHEIAGVVEALGSRATGLSVGDRVTTLSAVPCDQCDQCAAGAYRSCERGWQIYGYGSVSGGYAEYVLSHVSAVRTVPEGLSDVAAALNEPAMVGLHAVRASRLAVGQDAVVIGAGPIGLMVLQAALSMGAGRVWVLEPSPIRRGMAADLGASEALDPTTEDVAAFVAARTEAGPEVVFECAGAPGTLQRGIELVRPGGQVLLAGANYEPDSVFPLALVGKECEVKAVLGGSDLFGHALDLIAQGRMKTEALVTRIVGLDELDLVMQELGGPDGRDVKVLVSPSGRGDRS